MSDRATQLRHEIMIATKANGVPVTGDLWLGLVFASEEALIGIARELCIPVPAEPADPQATR